MTLRRLAAALCLSLFAAFAPASERAQAPASIVVVPAGTLAGVAGTATAVTYTIYGTEIASGIETYKVLAQGQLPSSVGTLYTAGGSTTSLVSSILLVNATGSAVSGVKLFAGGTAATNQVLNAITILANGSATYASGVWTVLDANGAVQSAVSGGTAYTAGTGLNLSSNQFSLQTPVPTTIGGSGADLSAAASGRYPKSNGSSVFTASSLAAAGIGTCSNAFARALNPDAAPTCNPVSLASDVTGSLPEASVTNLISDLAGKQATGNYITAITGDMTAAGPGPATGTLATVNGAPGTFGSASSSLTLTVNGKGLVPSVSSQSIQIAESQVTNLATDLGNKANTSTTITAGAGLTGGGDLSVNRTIDVANSDGTITVNANDIARAPLTGDVGCPGGSTTCTLATVNGNVGTFGDSGTVAQITANAKGLITAVTNVAIRAASAIQSGFMSILNYLELAGHYDAVADFGFVGDQVAVFDGACSTGAPTKVTSATAQFDQTVGGVANYYNGKHITLAGAGTSGAMLSGTISAVDSATQVTISGATCITTVTSKGLQFGTDNATAMALLASTINALTYQGASVDFGVQPTNRFGSSTCPTFNKQVGLRGQGSSVNLDFGDYTKAAGTTLAYWGTSHDCGNDPFHGFIRYQPVVSATTVAFDSAASNSTSSTSATTLSLSTTPVGTPTLAIADVQLTNGSSVSSLTYGGQAMTLIGCSAPGFSTCSYKLEYPPALGQTVTLTYAAAGISAMGVSLYTGTGTGATSNFVAANGSGTPATLNVTSAANHIAHASVIVAGTSSTATANNTSRYNVNFGSLPNRVGAAQDAAGAATVTQTWTLAGTGLTWAENGFDISPNTSAQPIVAPIIRDLTIDCRNGDQNQCYTGIQMFDVVGMDFSNFYVMDPLICISGDVLEPIGGVASTGRGQIYNFGCRVLELPSAPIVPSTTPTTIAAGSNNVVLTTSGATVAIASANLYTPGYFVVMMDHGSAVPVYCSGGGASPTTSLTGCRVGVNDALNNPTLKTGANIIQMMPNTGACSRWNGSSTAGVAGANSGNSNLFDASMWRCTGKTNSPAVTTDGFGMPCHDFANADSISFNQVVNNCGVPNNDGALNRVRKCGVRYGGSNVSLPQSARNNEWKSGDYGSGPACSVGVTSAGAALLAPAGPNYLRANQLGNNNVAPTLEANALLYWPDPNGGAPPAGLCNINNAAQGFTASTLTTVTGSTCRLAPQAFQVGGVYHWKLPISKTAAGVAGRVTQIRVGTTCGTGDTLVQAWAAGTATAAIDSGWMDITYNITTIGASATGQGVMVLHHAGATTPLTGLDTRSDPIVIGTPTTFNSVSSGFLCIGVSLTTGAAAVETVTGATVYIDRVGTQGN